MADKLRNRDFVHLHNHSQFSLLDGLTKIPALIDKVSREGMQAVAITDHGTMSGAIEFYKAARAANVKPIIGMETYVAARKIADRDPSKDKSNYHLILLAMDNHGYENLMRLSTIANLEGFYYKPRIDHQLLEKYHQGLIVLSGCIGGEVGDALRQGQYEQAKQIAKWYKALFDDRYYLEIQDHGHKDHPHAWSEQVQITKDTLRLAHELDIECVLTCDAHYLEAKDKEAHEVLLCIQTGSYLSDENRMSLKEFDLHVTAPKEVISRWGGTHPQLITNTSQIAARCKVELSLGNILIPQFPLAAGVTEKSFLQKLTYQGLAWRYGGVTQKKAASLTLPQIKKILPKTVRERASYELSVIEQMGFCGYFLIIADFIRWGKSQGIVFGPGRGSAAGSIIAYGLQITELDPLKYDLLFERFLNPDRISMPDIDIDIQDTRRDEVIQYCIDKYGEDRVANIVTFGTMAARNAVRDVARVLQVPYADSDRLAKMIPPPVQGRHIPLAKSLQADEALKQEYEQNPAAKQVFDLAVQLEGTVRSHGVHAAGVVIAPDDIVKYTPLEKAQKGVIATQYSMYPIVDDLGLLKMDFLGLSNLTIIKNTLRIIKKVYGKTIEVNHLDLQDKKTYKLLQHGDTTGVFQLESAGMKRYLRQLKPVEFEDIVAMVSLYRPGPLTAGLTDRFIARKNGLEPVSYDHSLMENSLRTTYGVLVYQEQVMQIAKDMCGFSGGEADTLRKAVGKKNREMMKKMKDKIIKGAVANQVATQVAEKFWSDLEGFADYAFNKSHAACYAFIAFQTAYLKAHFPAAFMAALMTSDFDNTDRLAIEIKECKDMNIEVLPPDVNESFVEFAVVPDTKQIRFGMSAIKNVGTGAVEEILKAREEKPFDSLEDFLSRVNTRVVNRKALESLIRAGAFDRFATRSELLHNLDVLLAYASRQQKERLSGQTDLFGNSDAVVAAIKSQLTLQVPQTVHSPREMLQWERDLLGLYLSRHPLDDYEDWLAAHTDPIQKINEATDNQSLTIGGVVTEIREITTKNGQRMAFVKIADLSGELEAVVFPSVYETTAEACQKDMVVIGKGRVSTKTRGSGTFGGEPKLLLKEVRVVTDEDLKKAPTRKKSAPVLVERSTLTSSPKQRRVYIRIHDGDNQDHLISLKKLLDAHHGNTEIVLVVGQDPNRQIIKLPGGVQEHEDVLLALQSVVGEENVKVQ